MEKKMTQKTIFKLHLCDDQDYVREDCDFVRKEANYFELSQMDETELSETELLLSRFQSHVENLLEKKRLKTAKLNGDIW